MKPALLCLSAALAIGLTACDSSPVEIEDQALGTPLQAKGGNGGGGNGGGGGGGGGDLLVSMSGDFAGAEQAISGKNDQRTLSAKGDYTLTMTIDPNLVCGDLPGSIPDEVGLVALVQDDTLRLGTLDVKYDKTGPDAGRIDSWTTTIGQYKYWVQFFRWVSADLSDNGVTTTVSYHGGSIVVFKMKGKRILSREQCFGEFVDYDLMVR